jgi:hypothetical protein
MMAQSAVTVLVGVVFPQNKKFLFKKIVCFLQFFITFAPYKKVSI